MESIKGVEKTLEKYYKNSGVPHLPKGLTEFLAEWAWLFTVIGVVLGVFGIFTAISAVLVAQSLLGVASVYGGSAYVAQASGSLWVTTALSIVISVVVISIQVRAIAPLRLKKLKGWELLFLASLVSVGASILSSLVSAVMAGGLSIVSSLFGIVLTLVFYAIGLYVLFEVKGHFTAAAAHKK